MYDKYIKEFVSDEAYYSDFNFITNSQLGLIKKSPATYQHYRDYPSLRPQTKALNFGRAFHMCMLEPEKFDEKVIQEPDVNKRTKAGREEYEEFVKENEDNTILTSAEHKSLMGMRNRLFSCHEAVDLLSGGVAEQVSVWKDKETGIECKCKADYWNKDKRILVDIKTTQGANMNEFRGSAYKYGYDRQSAFYSDGFKADDFVFIVIEKGAPYNIGIYYSGEEFISDGRSKYSQLLNTYKHYFIDKVQDPYEHTYLGTL